MAARMVINARPPSTAPTMAPTFRGDDDARFAWLFGVAPVEFDEGEVIEEGREFFEEASLEEVGVEEVEFELEDAKDAEDLPGALELEDVDVKEVEGGIDTEVPELEDGVGVPWVDGIEVPWVDGVEALWVDGVDAAEVGGSDVTALNITRN